MRPFLYYSPDFSIPSFAFMMMMASLVSTFVAYKMAPRRGLSQVAILDMAIIGTLCAVIGARLFHVFLEEWSYYTEHPTHVFQVWRGGFVAYGGIIGIAVGCYIYLRIRKLDALRYLDHVCLFAGPFIILVCRIGCLMAGCCYGKPSPFDKFEYLLFIAFTNRGSEAGHAHYGEHLWPTQIWEMGYALIIFAICYWVEGRIKFKGQVFLTFVLSYGVFRTAIEFFRGDESRGVYLDGTLSTSQIISFILFVLIIGTWVILKKNFPLDKPYPRYRPGEAPALLPKQPVAPGP
jgi:phosphatidylglycerol:prolipoprotein diacylglycerol transferase